MHEKSELEEIAKKTTKKKKTKKKTTTKLPKIKQREKRLKIELIF